MCCDSPAFPCLLLPEAERKTALQRAKVGSRYVQLEVSRKQRHEPSPVPAQASARPCNVLALGTSEEMGWE